MLRSFGVRTIGVFVQPGQNETRFKLATDLCFQCVAKLNSVIAFDDTLKLPRRKIDIVGIRQRMTDHQLTSALSIGVKYVNEGIHEPGKEDPAWLQDTKTFPPDHFNIWRIKVRSRMKNEVESACTNHRKIMHKAELSLHLETVPVCNCIVLCELFRRCVEYHHPCTGRS